MTAGKIKILRAEFCVSLLLCSLISIVLVSFSGQPAAFGAAKAEGPSGLETSLKFKAKVILPPEVKDTDNNVERIIIEQTKHLLGVLQSPQYARRIGARFGGLGAAGLGPLQSYRVISKEKTKRGMEITYEAVERIMFKKEFIAPKEVKDIRFVLPLHPASIYAKGCTDTTYPQKEFFFYFWNPFSAKCKEELKKKDGNELIEVTGRLRGLVRPNARAAPDYRRLLAEARRDGELRVSLLFGFDHKSTDPRDQGRQSYLYVYHLLLENGFQILSENHEGKAPHVDFYKEGVGDFPPVKVQLSLSASDVDHPIVFARRAREAFMHSHIVLYEGHSGLGGNLDLAKIEALSSPDPLHPVPIQFADFYQIYYFDSCDSYYFYSQMYNLAKRGAHNVDVISNGLPSLFEYQNAQVKQFLSFFVKPPFRCATWMHLLGSIEGRQAGHSYLVNVSNIPRRRD